MAKKFDGITVGGKSVEDFLTDEFSKDVEKIKQTHIHPKRKGRVKYMETKEAHGPVKRTAQSALNLTNLEINVARAKTKISKLIMYLLAGKLMSAKDCVETRITKHATSAAGYFRKLNKTNLAQYLIQEGLRNKGFVYHFNEDGCNLKPATALTELATAKVGERSPTSDPVPYKFPKLDTPTPIQQDLQLNITIKLKIEVSS